MGNRISKTVQAYRKERKRVRDYLSRKRREGFDFNFELPEIPPKITQKDVNYLKSITPYKLKKYGTYAGYETFGEIVSAYEGEKIRRTSVKTPEAIKAELEEFEKAPLKTEEFSDDVLNLEDVLIDRLFSEIETYPGKLGEFLYDEFNERLISYGREKFGGILWSMPDVFWDKLGMAGYDSEEPVEAFDAGAFDYFSELGVDGNEAINM